MTAILWIKRKTWLTLTNLVRQAAAQGAKLIVLPENVCDWILFDSMEQAAEMAEPIANGQTVRLLENLAKGVRLLFSCRTS